MKLLKELDLSHNLLSTLPHEFTKSAKLVDVDLSGNQLVSVPPDLFKHLKSLERLKLAHNKFSCLPSFTGIPNLTWVSFEGNPEKWKKRYKRRHTDPDISKSIQKAKAKSLAKRKPGMALYTVMYRLEFGWAEMRGRRPDQQDTVTIIPNFRDATTTHYVGLFDGHSGQRSAEYAASYLHVKLADALTETKERAVESLQLACRRTHQDIEAMKLKDGTAALLMLVVGHRFYIAHAGDSRAVLASGGKAIQLSKDHKPEDLSERERIIKAGGFVAESNRVNGILALTRALGDVDLQPAVTHEPEVIEREVTEEDQFVILACDGLWDMISNEQAVKIASKQKSPVHAAAKLRDYAYSLGSGDNISVVVVSFCKEGATTHTIGRRASDPSSTDSEFNIDDDE